MQIELLNETELKVTLTAKDLERYAIDCAHMDYGTTETRRAFWSILDEARRETGFDAARDRVYVRVYPSADGGCDMYVTKLAETQTEKRDTSCETAAPEEPHPVISPAAEKTPAELPYRQTVVYALDIDTADALIGLCALLLQRGYHAPSDAYVRERGGAERYYLTVTEEKTGNGTAAVPPLAILEEYGTRIASPAMRCSLIEHARCIAADNAVERLAALDVRR